MSLYKEFINIAKVLNGTLEIVPVLYGSLGLERVTKVSFSPQDIDILVPFSYLDNNWGSLKQTVEQMGYTLVDVQEHEFEKDHVKIGFSFIEDLLDFANVEYETLTIVEEDGATFYLLTIFDYLKVYKQSVQDGYRRTKNNDKDLIKLEVLNKLV